MEHSLLVNTTIALLTAFVLGGLIGLERQWRQRTAGLRTNVLVAVGAAAFVDLGMRVAGADGSVRVISYIVSGIGFLGAGVIMKEGAQVRGSIPPQLFGHQLLSAHLQVAGCLAKHVLSLCSFLQEIRCYDHSRTTSIGVP